MDLAIEVVNVKRITFSHMVVGIIVMLNMKVVIENMGVKDLHGTKREMFLQEQEIYWFQ